MRRRAFARTIESFVSALIILSSFVVTYYIVIPTNPYISQGRSDLGKFGYDLLQSMADNKGLDNIIFDSKGNIKTGWESQFKVILNELMPSSLIYNLTVYQVTETVYKVTTTPPSNFTWVELGIFNRYKISNVDSDSSFLHSADVAVASFFHTTPYITAISTSQTGYCILLFNLKIAKVGGV